MVHSMRAFFACFVLIPHVAMGDGAHPLEACVMTCDGLPPALVYSGKRIQFAVYETAVSCSRTQFQVTSEFYHSLPHLGSIHHGVEAVQAPGGPGGFIGVGPEQKLFFPVDAASILEVNGSELRVVGADYQIPPVGGHLKAGGHQLGEGKRSDILNALSGVLTGRLREAMKGFEFESDDVKSHDIRVLNKKVGSYREGTKGVIWFDPEKTELSVRGIRGAAAGRIMAVRIDLSIRSKADGKASYRAKNVASVTSGFHIEKVEVSASVVAFVSISEDSLVVEQPQFVALNVSVSEPRWDNKILDTTRRWFNGRLLDIVQDRKGRAAELLRNTGGEIRIDAVLLRQLKALAGVK